jgi:hypothetical protein
MSAIVIGITTSIMAAAKTAISKATRNIFSEDSPIIDGFVDINNPLLYQAVYSAYA